MADAQLVVTPSPKPQAGINAARAVGDAMLLPILAIFVALVLGGLVMWLVGANPIQAYVGLFLGAFGSARAVSETLVWATPYILAGLGVAFAFKGGLFNIGAEGQLAIGATTSAYIGFALPKVIGAPIPTVIHLPLVILGGCLAGALWGAIPGFLKARTGAHEVINTIMMNYIALLFIGFLLNGPLKDPSPTNVIARTPEIALSARIPVLIAGYRVHWGFIIAILVAVLVWWILYRTTFGYEVRAVGASPDAAKYAGMKVGWIVVLTMGISGLLAGMAGVVEVTALNFRHELSFSVGYGFDAITVALLGRNNPFGVILAALLIGGMRNGATQMQFVTQVPVDIISVIQGLILLFVAADTIIRQIFRIRAAGAQLVLTRGWGE